MAQKIVEKCHYGNSYSDENIILFFVIYHNEFHIFEHTVKLYQQHANTNLLTTTIDQYEFNVLHKVAFKGSINYFNVLKNTFSDIILRAALFIPARLLRDNEVRDHNGKVIGRNIITPLDIICMNNNKPLLQYLITRRIINESLLKAYYQFKGELNDSIVKLSDTKTINDEFKVLLQRHMFSITPQSFSLRTWTRKIEHYTRIMPSLTEAISQRDSLIDKIAEISIIKNLFKAPEGDHILLR